MFESINAGWMDLGVAGTKYMSGTTSAREVFAVAQEAAGWRRFENAMRRCAWKWSFDFPSSIRLLHDWG